MNAAPAPLSLEELKSFLWGAATLLRGQIDASGYKEFIFPLLFFKRISDVYDEQFGVYLDESGGDAEYAAEQEYPVRIPSGCLWRDVRKCAENVGRRLVDAFTRIESANPPRRVDGLDVGGLSGIFGDKSGWLNKNKMPDAIVRSLVEHFSRHNLSLAACPADEMGLAYEYLIGQFANDAGHTAQEFYTNRTVVELMAEMLRPAPGETLYDPTCGSGGMLVKSLEYVRNRGGAWRSVRVFGQEVNALTSAIARMNLYLHGVEDFSVACADTLAAPAFTDGGAVRRFDVVLANPPYSIKDWDRASFEHDRWGRNTLGTPPQGRADYAFLQHILASLDRRTGRAAVLLPHGVLFRQEEREMRRKLVESDLVEAVVGLGANLFFNSPMEACILVLRTRKPPARRNRILFVNAVLQVARRNAESFLEDAHRERILAAYRDDDPKPGFSRSVPDSEIEEKDWSLSIPLYVAPPAEAGGADAPCPPLPDALAAWEETRPALAESLAALDAWLEPADKEDAR